MKSIRKGDIVTRKSYGSDILFEVEDIFCFNKKNKYANLKGITLRIKANAPLQDLQLINKENMLNEIKKIDKKIDQNIEEKRDFFNKYLNMFSGKILHLDGDRRYAEKSLRYYKKLGLNAVVKNISEAKQPMVVGNLIKKYQPDILVITGHDGMIKNGTGYMDLYNYRNSRFFINTVKQARRSSLNKELVIFAGACQSFFEAIMDSGANYASSPARILIDFMDPLLIAEKIAITPEDKKIEMSEISKVLKDDLKRIGGITTRGRRKKYNF